MGLESLGAADGRPEVMSRATARGVTGMMSGGKRGRKLWPALALMVLLGTACTGGGEEAAEGNAQGATLARIRDSGVLRDCAYLQYPPEVYKDDAGNPAGFGVELAKAMAEELSVELDVIETDFEGIIPALQSNKCDIAITGMTPKPERALAVTFAKISFLYVNALLVASDDSRSTIDEFNQPDVKMCVQTGTSSQETQEKYFPDVQVTSLQDIAQCYLEVQSGRVDAVPVDSVIGNSLSQEHPEVKPALVDGELGVNSASPVLQYGDWEFMHWVDLFVGRFIVSGEYRDLFLSDVGYEPDIERLLVERGGTN